MHFKHYLHAVMAIVAGCMLASCHSEVDMNNIDPKAEFDLGLALPIGSVNVTMGDFLGGGTVEQIYVDEYGVFHFKSKLEIPTKPYHSIDVKDYIIKNASQLVFNVSDQVPAGTPLVGTGTQVYPIPPFDLNLTFSGINDDLSDERIDSIWITEAVFSSWIDVSNFDLQWDEIKSVKLVLDSAQFRRPKGMEIDLPIAGKGFGQKLEIRVDDFTMNLLKDQTDPNKGTVNSIAFKLKFEVCPANGHTIIVQANSQLKYDLSVDVIDYDAIWGFFEAGNQMRNTDTLSLKNEWSGWDNMKKMKMRFAEPRVDVFITHRVAAPLVMYIDHIKAIDSLGNTKPATWNGNTSTAFYFERPDEYISPLAQTINDSITLSRAFTHEEDKGNIDELFDVRPDSFIYSFHLAVNKTALSYDANWSKWKQLRIMKDTRVSGYALVDIPFKFNEGSEIAYTAVIDSVNLTSFSLDSLLASVPAIDTLHATSLRLIVQVKNSIPFDIMGTFTFLDKDSMNLGLVLVEGNTTNTFHFPAPTMSAPGGPNEYGEVKTPSETTIILNVDKNDFDRLAQIKKVVFEASITDNPQRCKITKSTGINIRLGITGKIDAVVDMSKTGDNNNNQQ